MATDDSHDVGNRIIVKPLLVCLCKYIICECVIAENPAFACAAVKIISSRLSDPIEYELLVLLSGDLCIGGKHR